MYKKYGLLINGKWTESGSSFKVLNPSNNKEIASVSNIDDTQILEAINSSERAFKYWSELNVKKRSDILKKFFHLVIKNRKKLAKIITLESGKPLLESLIEVDYGASFIEWSAEQALRLKSEMFDSPEKEKNVYYETTYWCSCCNNAMELSSCNGHSKGFSSCCCWLFCNLKTI